MNKLLRAMTTLADSLKRLLLGHVRATSSEVEEFTIELEPLSPERRALSQDELFREAGVVLLKIPHFMQEDELAWCYAACGKMILAAYNMLVEQCDIAGRVLQEHCCADPIPSVCVERGCDQSDIAPIYTSRGISAARHQPHGIITLAALQNELLAHRPVEVTRRSKEQENSFHAVVIKGFQDDTLFIHDPLVKPTVSPYSYTLPYKTLISGAHYTWDETWVGFPSIQ